MGAPPYLSFDARSDTKTVTYQGRRGTQGGYYQPAGVPLSTALTSQTADDL